MASGSSTGQGAGGSGLGGAGAAWSSRQESQSWIEAHLVFIAEQEALQEEEARLAALAEETEAAPTE